LYGSFPLRNASGSHRVGYVAVFSIGEDGANLKRKRILKKIDKDIIAQALTAMGQPQGNEHGGIAWVHAEPAIAGVFLGSTAYSTDSLVMFATIKSAFRRSFITDNSVTMAKPLDTAASVRILDDDESDTVTVAYVVHRVEATPTNTPKNTELRDVYPAFRVSISCLCTEYMRSVLFE
jgi:hypothetical protein